MSDLVGNSNCWFSHAKAHKLHCMYKVRIECTGIDTINPYLTNGFSHHYHLGESTFIFRGIRGDF